MSLRRLHPIQRVRQFFLVIGLGGLLFWGVASTLPLAWIMGSTALLLLVYSSLGFSEGFSEKQENAVSLSAIQSAWSLGITFFAALSILFYISYDAKVPFSQSFLTQGSAAIVIVGAWIFLRHGPPNHPSEIRWVRWIHFSAIASLFVAVGMAASKKPFPTVSVQEPLKVLSWNIQQGFDSQGRQALSDQADLIQRSGAQVVGLQEVARGWLTGGRPDTGRMISELTQMPLVFGETADRIWGNAILTSLPILETEKGFLPQETSFMRRGYLRAHLDWNGRHLWVINTHLHHVENSEEGDRIREVQAKALVEQAWRLDQSVIVLGDFNAKPDSDTIRYLLSTGLRDGFLLDPGFTFRSDRPDRRIDYIFTSPDLEVKNLSIIDTLASDHKAVLAEIQFKEK